MNLPILQNAAALGAILDAYSAPSLIVDEDVRALFINRAARLALGLEGEQFLPNVAVPGEGRNAPRERGGQAPGTRPA